MSRMKKNEALNELKKPLFESPILTLPYDIEHYEVYNDASWMGLGCALTERGKVILNDSRRLKEHTKNYLTHDFELAAVIHDLKFLRYYLYGTKCKVLIDHKSF